MAFAYFDRLTPEEQAIYRRSDEVHALRLPPPDAEALRPVVEQLRHSLSRDDARAVLALAEAICFGIAVSLGAAPPAFELLNERPRGRASELHGLYRRGEDEPSLVRVWMRTARRSRVVAFRTFLRTLLHELVHHLDFELLGLPASFHTEGFYMRETSLFHQLVPGVRRRKQLH